MQLQRDGVKLVVHDTGSGTNPLVLVHGWGTDHTVFDGMIDALSAHHRIVRLDLRGHGESDAPASGYSVRTFADDVIHVINSLELDQPVIVGHSMGGLVTADVTARLGDRVRAMVLLESPVVPDQEMIHNTRDVIEHLQTERWKDVAAGLIGVIGGRHFAGAEALLQQIYRCRQDVLVACMQSIVDYDGAAAAEAIECPVLYIGTHMQYVDMPRFEALCPQMIEGQVVGCGHYFPMEVPEQVVPMIRRFLDVVVRG